MINQPLFLCGTYNYVFLIGVLDKLPKEHASISELNQVQIWVFLFWKLSQILTTVVGRQEKQVMTT